MGESNSKACLEGVLRGATRTHLSPTGTPLPRLLHRKLRRDEICRPGGRLFIVGDVHGCVEDLKKLLNQEAFKPGTDSVVFVGDLVNKGPESGEVIRFARQCRAFGVRGNHDDELLEAWHRVGRFAKGLEKYRHDALYQVTSKDIEWLQELPLTISLPWLKLIIVHAGILPERPLESQDFKHLLWLRDLRPTDSGFVGLEASEEGSQPWAQVWNGPEHIVFGHDAKRKLQQEKFATGLDTGCCYGFKLSMLVLDPDNLLTRRIAQVNAERVYAPPKDRSDEAQAKL